MKKLFTVILLGLILVLSACGSNGKSDVIKVGTTTSEVPTWNLVKDLAEKEGIKIEIVKFDDYVQPNLALDSGEIDINAFQTIVYFDKFKEERKLDLAAIGTTNIWPMGIYSKKVKDINELKDGDQIVIPKDPTNLGRALLLLQKAGLVTLKEGFDGTGGVENIAENPKNLEITPVDAGQTARGLDDAAASIINSDMAINAGLNPTNDPVFREDASNKAYVNIIAAHAKRKDDETLKKIVDIYHTDEVKSFIEKEFNGAAVPVREPISFLDDYKQN
ncbi:MetQ/NlpA family ABC transporter substrate-binding protein [Lederbergia wuyishanensis]|uniref:Lipoprotein n=1 Tax=Lederbergia wuyishanensis TaxID=1347903 RepID=A0ABU0D9B2_9BACI|nr:MetQ/NlpA family ABC transporter substrate-binding protein [Lederbergia wuyishanensis]MCJ8009421.1 MetQ/NlpA family ABC transporter substrate-binding protein [Lederbergia wuyishanensis]MDQ0344970.1 D-methionine transport system substrate-binding protein [Lederbergia wuyishanensis]